GVFANSELKDLGTMDALEYTQSALGKGKPGTKKLVSSRNSSQKSNSNPKDKKGESNNKKSDLMDKKSAKQSNLRVSSTSTQVSSLSTTRARSPAALSRASSPDASATRLFAKKKQSKSSELPALKSSTQSKAQALRDRSSSQNPRGFVESPPNYDGSSDRSLSDVSYKSQESESFSQIGNTDNEPPRKGKPKSKDYVGAEFDILEATVNKVKQRLLVKGWFIDPKEYDPLIARTWRYSALKLDYRPSRKRVTLRKIRAIKFRMTSFQGRLKDAVKTHLVSHYKLKRGTEQEIAEWAKFLASQGRFHTKSLIPGVLPSRDHKKRKNKKRQDDSDDDSGEESMDDSIVCSKLTDYFQIHHQNLLNMREADPERLEALRKQLFDRGLEQSRFKLSKSCANEDSDDGVIAVAHFIRGKPSTKSQGKKPAAASDSDRDSSDDDAGDQSDGGAIPVGRFAEKSTAAAPKPLESPAREKSGTLAKQHNGKTPTPKRLDNVASFKKPLTPVVSKPRRPQPRMKVLPDSHATPDKPGHKDSRRLNRDGKDSRNGEEGENSEEEGEGAEAACRERRKQRDAATDTGGDGSESDENDVAGNVGLDAKDEESSAEDAGPKGGEQGASPRKGGGGSGTLKRTSPRKQTGECEGGRRVSPHKKCQANSEDDVPAASGSKLPKPKSKRRKHIPE
ncbi:hypothetical protein FRC07_010091, partial [Ceratobasidium sp. 392]